MILEKENMNTIGPAGDIFLEPLNMKPAGSPEPDDSGGGGGADDDDIRNAHRDMIVGQWLRIIKKQNNSIRKVVKPGFFEGHRAYAKEILFDQVNAYASTKAVGVNRVRQVVDSVINERIRKTVPLLEQDARILTERIMREIGENHGN